MQRYHEVPTEVRRKRRIMSKHGISSEEYDLLIAPGICAICGRSETRTKGGTLKGLAVDHCHTTGAVRGLLCHACNDLLGRANDEIAILHAAVAYLQKAQENTR
jgi:hypothetical protein